MIPFLSVTQQASEYTLAWAPLLNVMLMKLLSSTPFSVFTQVPVRVDTGVPSIAMRVKLRGYTPTSSKAPPARDGSLILGFWMMV